MTEAASAQPVTGSGPAVPVALAPARIDFSCRPPLMVMFVSAAIWAVIASVLGLIASLKFHAPALLADSPALTYGRVHPAFTNAMLYGFCLQAGLAVALWLVARLSRARLATPGLVTFGAALWNLGLTVGVLGIFAGQSTGFENLELPGYAALMLFLGYLLIGIPGMLTFHRRDQGLVFVSQWFIVAALFWFPWIFSTAELLLVSLPVRGVVQSVVNWWYSNNLIVVWLGLVGLAAVFYFVPKLSNRELHSHYLALVTFLGLLLFASWGGIPASAPLPAWMSTASAILTVLTLIPLVTVPLNVYATIGRVAVLGKAPVLPISPPASGAERAAPAGGTPVEPSLSFILFAVAAFTLAGLMRIFGVLLDPYQLLPFTWFTTATAQLHSYGFFAMAVLGAIYWVLPRVCGLALPWPKLVRAHFWLAAAGIILIVLPLALGGVVQCFGLQNPALPFADIFKSTLPFLRVSTLGDLLLLAGHALLLVNLVTLAYRLVRLPTEAAYATMTADLFAPAEVKP